MTEVTIKQSSTRVYPDGSCETTETTRAANSKMMLGVPFVLGAGTLAAVNHLKGTPGGNRWGAMIFIGSLAAVTNLGIYFTSVKVSTKYTCE